MQHLDSNGDLHGSLMRDVSRVSGNKGPQRDADHPVTDLIERSGGDSDRIASGPDGATKIPLIRRSRHREELEYDLLLVLLWVSKNVPSNMFEQIYTLIWNYTRLDDGERDEMLAMMRELGDARFGAGRDSQSPPER